MANSVCCEESKTTTSIGVSIGAQRNLANLRRAGGIAFGLGTQVFFLATVVQLFRFLAGTLSRPHAEAWFGNSLLCLQFAVPHSLLLHPHTRRYLSRWIDGAFYGCFYCCVTCLSLWIVFTGWRSSDIVLVEVRGAAASIVTALFVSSWIALFYSLSLNGLGYQTGLTPWWYWLRRRPQPRRTFVERGAYRWFRHPIYLSFLVLLWFTPVVTLDRALLVAIWSVYIYLGSILKDRRLAYYLGSTYLEYAARVPGYPGISRGSLGRISRTDAST